MLNSFYRALIFFRSDQCLSKVTHSSALKNLWSWMNCLQENRSYLDRPTQRNGPTPARRCKCVFFASFFGIWNRWSFQFLGCRSIGSVMVDYPSQSFVRFLGGGIFSYKLGPWKSLLPSFAKIMSLSFPFGWWSTEKPLKKWWKRVNQPCNFLNLGTRDVKRYCFDLSTFIP